MGQYIFGLSVYKARYFPNYFFMMTKLGNNPSFIWRSILAAMDIIKEGTRSRMEPGLKVMEAALLLDKIILFKIF